MMSEESDYIEVKVYSKGISKGKAEELVDQGVSGFISGGSISKNAKKILDKNNVWHREKVEPSDLESESKETEKEG